ncbi:Aip5p SKDI_06G0750 [Saccharomyces kudriavzevii IFO 1802]|uniref:YFR016C-like protein n=1 Tax=Saccharomyces kudriavzevii (strain ATCC MYA-4449 / AS 2.2408 / CBS 8840 / NBRC 1802 / NCYC 2889) TaxID=226230 RepID=A0AA35NSB5_SACK1|nr:uncharacterized protein SKDI_06G0750 [Saccharomyces kudriavzevii IFO 1802]CAI4061003.1 hypothetical protein SKDI_06G0750 [Saccharomyces kudriavzevii IFO 1802]
MIESLTVEDQEFNAQLPKKKDDGNSHTMLPTDSPLTDMNELTKNNDQLTENELDEVISATENFAMELSSQRKSLKSKTKKKKYQGRKKTNKTIAEPCNSDDETIEIMPQDISSHDLKQEDNVIKVNIDTVNERTEGSNDVPTNVNIVVKETSAGDTAENAEYASSANGSARAGMDNSPTEKSKRGKKRKNMSKKARNTLNPTSTADFSKQTTLDSILVGIEEYLQDDDPKDEDIKVNVVRTEAIGNEHNLKNGINEVSPKTLSKERFDEQGKDVDAPNGSIQKIFNADVANKGCVDKGFSEGKNQMNETEDTITSAGHETSTFDENDLESVGYQQEPHDLDEGQENAQAFKADSLLQRETNTAKNGSLAENEFRSNVSGSELSKSRGGEQAEIGENEARVLVLVKEEEEEEEEEEQNILEQEAKKNKKSMTANHDDNKSSTITIDSVNGNITVTPESKQKVNLGETADQIRCIGNDEENLQNNTTELSLEAGGKEKENKSEQRTAVRDKETFGIEEGSRPKEELLLEGDRNESEAEENFIVIELKGNAKSAMNSGRNSSIEDETRTASQENKPKENINLETSTEDAKRESVRIAETTETTKDDVEIAKETQKGEEVEPVDATEDFKNDRITGSAGIIEKDIKTKHDGIAQVVNEDTKSEDSSAAKKKVETTEGGMKSEDFHATESPKEVMKPEDSELEKSDDLEVIRGDNEIFKEDTKTKDFETTDFQEQKLKAEFSRTNQSHEEDTQLQDVGVATEGVETVKEDVKGANSAETSKGDTKCKDPEIVQEEDKIFNRDVEIKNANASEAVGEILKVENVETAEKDIKSRDDETANSEDLKLDSEAEDFKAVEKTKETSKYEGIETAKEGDIIAKEDTRDDGIEDAEVLIKDTTAEDMKAGGASEENTKVGDPKLPEVLKNNGKPMELEIPQGGVKGLKIDVSVEDVRPAATSKDEEDQDVESARVSEEHENAEELPELGKEGEEISKEGSKTLGTEKEKKENVISGLAMSSKITEGQGEGESGTAQVEEGINQLDLDETVPAHTRGPGDESGAEEAKELSKAPTIDDIFKDILEETDEFLEQLKIVDDSEINALLQSLDEKETATQAAKQPTPEQYKAPAVIKTSEIRKLNEQEPVYIYTSLAGGGFHMIARTNRLSTILTANRIPFTYRDLGTDDEARKVWKTFSKGRCLPGVVRGRNDLIGNWEDIEEANEDYRLQELIYDTI